MKLNLILKRIISIAFFSAAILDPYILFASCPQNNITVTGFQLRNQDGNLFSVTDDYELGESVTGELWVNFGGSTTNGYNLLMFYDVVVNGVLVANDQYDCIYSGQQVILNVWVKVRDFTWNWGDIIEIKDIFMYWETGTVKPETTCVVSTKSNINSQCYSNPDGFTAAVPLFPKFDFDSNGICNTTIQFTSETIGGTPPFNYTFSWDFNNDGIIDSTSENPIYNFPSSGTYPITLTVNDGTTTTTIVKEIFIDPNFGIQVTIFPTKINDESGIIYVESVTGGTEPYTYYWTGPNGFTSTDKDIFNLADGLYQLTVTDANGCQQTEEYLMDIASVLNLTWKSFELTSSKGTVKLTWEMTSEATGVEYEIQRSLGNITDFVTIGTVLGQKSNAGSSSYEFLDEALPRTHERFYYRILRKMQGLNDFSEVKMIDIPLSSPRDTWLIYPNPSSGGNFNLNFNELLESKESLVTLDLLDTGNFSRKESIPIRPGQTIQLQDIFGTLPKGIIILKIQDGKQVKILKLINNN